MAHSHSPFRPQPRVQLNLNFILLLGAACIGGLLLVVPVQYVLILLFAMVAGVFSLKKPVISYVVAIFSSPFMDRLVFLPGTITLFDLLLVYSMGIALLHRVFLAQKTVSLQTPMDGFIGVLVGLFFWGWFHSEEPAAMFTFIRFLEGIAVYYLTVYYYRIQHISKSGLVRLLIMTMGLQALYGILQSVTGSFGAYFESDRGYLGYVGLGSKHVWHGQGAMKHFNILGNHLTMMLLFLLPMYQLLKTKKSTVLGVMGVLLLGIICTYSRGSLLGLVVGLAVFNLTFLRNPIIGVGMALSIVGAVAWGAIQLLSDADYASTISDRFIVWEAPLAAIQASAHRFWLGYGLHAMKEAIYLYIPAYVAPEHYQNFRPHNYYLYSMVEFGLLGTLVYLGVLISMGKKGLFNFLHRRSRKHMLGYGLALALAGLSVMSLVDHVMAYTTFYAQFFFLLAIAFTRKNPFPQKVTIPVLQGKTGT